MPLEVDLRSFGSVRVLEHIVLEHDDLKATNTAANPNNVKPHNGGNASADGSKLTALLPRASWNVIRLKV
jgi:alpha-N-arabinofuranosidase